MFKIEQARLRYQRFDGSMTGELVRLSFQRGDAAAAVVHDRAQDTVTLVEQFRYSTLEHGPGWTLEIPAGMVDPARDADPVTSIQRDLIVEIGCCVDDLQPMSTFYPSPGGSSVRFFVYYACVCDADKVAVGGGVQAENEDIRIVTLSVGDALAKVAAGEILDAKTIIGLQWLQLRRANHS
jgi:ADP-ribose pyrophosphatase